MEKNKKIIKLCYLQIAFYVVFLTSLLLHFKRGLDHRAFALLIILTLLGCASALTLTDYLKSLIAAPALMSPACTIKSRWKKSSSSFRTRTIHSMSA